VAHLRIAARATPPVTDHLGTTRDLAEYDSGTDTTSIANHRDFDSFGNLISETDDTVTILVGFTARPFDTATGLQWNLNRWYISTLGVWMSEDPIGLGPDSNPRRYVENQPTMLTDPSGLAPPSDPAAYQLWKIQKQGKPVTAADSLRIDNRHIKGAMIANDFKIAICDEVADQLQNLQIELATLGLGHGASVIVEVVTEAPTAWRWYSRTRVIAKSGDKSVDITDRANTIIEGVSKKNGRAPTPEAVAGQIESKLSDCSEDLARKWREATEEAKRRVGASKQEWGKIDARKSLYPGNPFTGKDAPQQAYKHLQKYHGLDPNTASERLHRIKAASGLGAADDVAIGRTGDVYNAATGERIGSLTDRMLGN
jgi:RHS repeat-associated protein